VLGWHPDDNRKVVEQMSKEQNQPFQMFDELAAVGEHDL